MSTPLLVSLQKALLDRETKLVPSSDLQEATPCSAPDLFSNDYLSLCADVQLRQDFLDKAAQMPQIFGMGGPRLLSGNAPALIAFEDRMRTFFRAPAALIFSSGYDANVAFWHSVPQANDAVVLDEYVHASTRDGLLASRARAALFPFAHNSLPAFRKAILKALKERPQIAAGQATLFIAVESLYSMDSDWAPLPEIVRVMDELVPAGCGHIVVDEAHSTGIYGAQGRGIVSALGLADRIDTVLHPFSKARALHGAVLLCTPTVRKYIINYGRPFIFSSSLSFNTVCALNASFDYIESAAGEELIASLHRNARIFEQKLNAAFKDAPSSPLLRLPPRETPAGFPAEIVSPMFPVFTSAPIPLSEHLRALGYATRPIAHPIVLRGSERIRIVVHARNTEAEFDELIEHLLEWKKGMEERENEARKKEECCAPSSSAPTNH